MRLLCLSVGLLLACLGTSPLQYRVSPVPPGLVKANTRMNRPLEPPMFSPHKSINFAQLRDESQELQRLADSIPAQIDQVTSGQLPKDLLGNLKKIERLSKHLRSQVSP